MTTKQTQKNIYAKLVKSAQDLLENATAQEESTVGPQEAVDALEEVIDDLEVLQEAIPAEPSAEEGIDATEGEAIVDAEPQAVAEPEEDEPIVVAKRKVRKAADDDKDDDEDKEKDAKIRNLSVQVARLNSHIAKEELVKIAKEYAETIHNDTKTQQAKYDEILKSDKTAKYWEGRLDAIVEYQDANTRNDNSFAKPAKTFSSYRTAKLQTNIQELNL